MSGTAHFDGTVEFNGLVDLVSNGVAAGSLFNRTLLDDRAVEIDASGKIITYDDNTNKNALSAAPTSSTQILVGDSGEDTGLSWANGAVAECRANIAKTADGGTSGTVTLCEPIAGANAHGIVICDTATGQPVRFSFNMPNNHDAWTDVGLTLHIAFESAGAVLEDLRLQNIISYAQPDYAVYATPPTTHIYHSVVSSAVQNGYMAIPGTEAAVVAPLPAGGLAVPQSVYQLFCELSRTGGPLDTYPHKVYFLGATLKYRTKAFGTLATPWTL
jgi:hypothetical protein